MAGGGTGGHVIPLLAVARILRDRGHQVAFVGTERGIEARLVPGEGFPIHWIEVGGLKGLGIARRWKTAKQLPVAIGRVLGFFRAEPPAAVFSMGGYAAGPVVFAAILRRVPLVVMEPNVMPGMVNRFTARFVKRALLSFDEARRWFPAGRTETTGMPVRKEFFALPTRTPDGVLNVLITGGSQGSRTLNRAAEESWPIFRESGRRVRMVLQTGRDAYAEVNRKFAESGVEGEVVPFIPEMPAAFATADVIVCRSGAGAVAELAAAGKASILVPFPFAADQHQLRNAEALARAGAARLVLDAEMNGRRLFEEVTSIPPDEVGALARAFARPGAAERAADVLEEVSGGDLVRRGA